VLVRLNADLIRPQFEVAEAQYVRDRIEFERINSLVQENATSRKELDDATRSVSASKAQWDEARARLERTKILAPSGGVLNSLPVEEGEYVQPGTPVAQVVDMQTVKVAVEVPQPDIAFFEVGQEASVVADVRGCQHTLLGKITYIDAVADEQTRSTRVEITVDNTDGLLHSGQIVQAHLLRRVLKNAIFIPLLAVIPMESGKAVYVAESGQAQRREVELGLIKADRIQVTQGLEPGDLLIVAGHRFVAPGQKIEITSQKEGAAGN
jgi:membrane fusion protein (multidrug efflux system)